MWIVLSAAGLLGTQAFADEPGDKTDKPAGAAAKPRLVLVVGAAGTDEYAEAFSGWAAQWMELADKLQWDVARVEEGLVDGKPQSQKERLQAAIQTRSVSAARLWVVLIGHGTYAAGKSKFNLVGPDLEAKELSSWLDASQRPSVVAGCFSSSGAFMGALSRPERLVLTATQNGSEINYSRFGGYLADAISDPRADLDHDDEVSLLEAFLAAATQTERFYEDAARLATEHPLLDDNADKSGTPASFFVGARAVGKAKDGKLVDGRVASRVILTSLPTAVRFPPELDAQRGEIEKELDLLRGQKDQLESEVYYASLEQLMLELAKVYAAAERLENTGVGGQSVSD